MIPEPEVNWLAGLLEGEGSFLTGTPSAPNAPAISMAMVDADVVRRAADLLGVNRIFARKGKGKAQDSYQFRLRGRRAVDAMRQLHPLMGSRRQAQIQRALASNDPHYRSRCRGTLTDEQVLEVYCRAHAGERLRHIAQDMGIPYTRCIDIKLGRTWSWLTGHPNRRDPSNRP